MAASTLSMVRDHAGFVAAWKREVSHLKREPWDLAFITLFPWVMLVLMMWLFSASVMRDIPIAVVDHDNSAESRLLLRMVDASPGVRISRQLASVPEAFSSIRRGDTFALVYIPQHFGKALRLGRQMAIIDFYNASYLTTGQSASRDINEAVTAFNARFLSETLAAQRGLQGLRPAPVAVQAHVLSNPARSYELFLLLLICPAVLSLASGLAMASALGREIRDGTCDQWLGDAPIGATLGKLMPYVLLFTLYGLACLAYICGFRGHGIAGSVMLLIVGQCLLHMACAGVACMLIGILRDMGSALSLVGLTLGASLAFSGATFPTIEAPVFAQIWSVLLPLTAYEQVQSQQVLMGSAWMTSSKALGTLCLISIVCGGIGLWRIAQLGKQFKSNDSRGQ